ESVDAAIAAERARHANAGNDVRGSGPVRGQDAAPVVRECTFVGFMKCSPTDFHGIEGAVKLQRWFDKTKSVFGINECVEGKKNNQKQRNARAMITAPPDGKVSSGSLPLCERCFTRHVVPCTIKCYKCGKVGHKERNRCSKKVKQEEAEEVRGRAYAIKDAEPKGPNVVTADKVHGNKTPVVDLQDGLTAVAIGDAAQLSIEKGRFVRIMEVMS
nr:oxidoreductase family protein [Tanacetum cinerariifolium]